MLPFLHLLPDKFARRLVRRYREIDGFLSETEAAALFRCANQLSSSAIAVEIGSWKGKSTYCIARGLRGAARLQVVDPFDAAGEPGSAETYARERRDRPLREQFEVNIAPVADRIDIHQGYSSAFTERFPRIDLLLIDGDHSIAGSRFDFEHYAAKIPSGGFLIFHDYYPDRPELGPTWTIQNLVKPSDLYREYRIADSLWIGRKL